MMKLKWAVLAVGLAFGGPALASVAPKPGGLDHGFCVQYSLVKNVSNAGQKFTEAFDCEVGPGRGLEVRAFMAGGINKGLKVFPLVTVPQGQYEKAHAVMAGSNKGSVSGYIFPLKYLSDLSHGTEPTVGILSSDTCPAVSEVGVQGGIPTVSQMPIHLSEAGFSVRVDTRLNAQCLAYRDHPVQP